MSDFPLDEDLCSPPISPSPSDSTQLGVRMQMLTSKNNFYSLSEEEEEEGMTPTQLHFTWASGHIPVLLYDEAYTKVDSPDLDQDEKEFSISDFTLASVINVNVNDSSVNNRRSSCVPVSPRSDSGNGSSRPTSHVSWTGTNSQPVSEFLGLQSLDSSNTITSVGTFGPRRKNRRNSNIEQGISGPFADLTSLDQQPQDEERDGVFTDGAALKRDPSIPQNLASIFASSSVLADLKRTSVVEKPETSGTHTSRRRSGRRKSITDFDGSCVRDGELEESEPESPSTPRKPIPKTISWISSRDWNCQQYKEYVAQADLSFSPQTPTRALGKSREPEGDIENEEIDSTLNLRRRRRSPIRTKEVLENRDLNVIVETPRASQFPQEIQDHHHRHHQTTNKLIPHEIRHPSPAKNPILQDEYRWLKDITVQFLIDQEGFRAAQPSFKFSGISRLRYPPHSSKSSTTTMAQFRPVTRQAFHFHYAPFESPPILRRVTVNLDETHDYLTKQALLTLKSNGVYVLHGQEMPLSNSSAGTVTDSSSEPSKLCWQFEYMIDDRRVEASGRIMEGEKNFIPLTFSCSPGLLSPTQGKRNSIMHVFKKGLAMKLVSEKLQPPGISSGPTGHSKSSASATVNEAPHPPPHRAIQGAGEGGAHIAHFFTSKAHAWSIHKRGQSHGVQNTSPPKGPFYKTQLRDIESAQHRRAYSGGPENQVPSSGLHFNTDASSSSATVYTSPESRKAVPMMIPPSRHIIPPQKLAELLDNGSPPSNAGQPIHSISPSNKFAPLSPRPRKTSHNKGLPHTP